MHRLALLLALTCACVADSGDEGFSIRHNLAPGMTCELTPGGAFLSRGIIDKQSPNPYLLTPEFVSRISPAQGTEETQRTIALRGARIEVFDVTGSTRVSKGKFTSLFAASLAPLGTTAAAFDIVTPEMLASAPASGNTRAQYLAHITPFGALGGSGDTLDGVPFDYPVTICDGCVAQSAGACPLPAGTVVPTEGINGCNKYQDGSALCCTSGTQLICPATVATAAQ